MAFPATEGSTQPIVLGKEPVPKPEIFRGDICTFTACVIGLNAAGDRVTFRARHSGFVITYHHARIDRRSGEMLYVHVDPDTVVTWEKLPG